MPASREAYAQWHGKAVKGRPIPQVDRGDYTGKSNGGYGDEYGGSYPTADGGWRTGTREQHARDHRDNLVRARKEAEAEEARKAAEEQAQGQAASKGPASAFARAGMPEPYSKEWFQQQQDQARAAKTDELIRKHRSEAEAAQQRTGAAVDKARVEIQHSIDRIDKKSTGRGFPNLSGILNDSGAVLKKMKDLEGLAAQERVRYNGDEVDPQVPLNFYRGELIKLSTAVIKMLEMGDRDLTKIIDGHQGTRDEGVARRVKDDFKMAYASAGLSVQSFNGNKFQDGVKQLARAMRLDRAASKDVSDWAGDVIGQADLCAKTAQSVRDTALDGLEICAAVEGGVVVWIVGAAKAGAKVSDAMIEKGEVPWKEIATDWIVGKLNGAVFKWVGGALGKKLVPGIEAKLLKRLGSVEDAKLLTDLLTRAAAQVGKVAEDEVGEIAKDIKNKQPGPGELPLAFIARMVAERFTLAHLQEMLKKHILQDRMLKPGWKALVESL